MQNLADTYSWGIVRLYGTAGHGKDLIDTMSKFGVKAILRRDLLTLDIWFADSWGICPYLIDWGDKRMSNSQIVETSRQYKDAKTMQGFMKGHMFVYTLKSCFGGSSYLWFRKMFSIYISVMYEKRKHCAITDGRLWWGMPTVTLLSNNVFWKDSTERNF